MTRAGVSEQEVVRGRGLGSVAGAGEGGAARYTRGHRGGERQVPEPACSQSRIQRTDGTFWKGKESRTRDAALGASEAVVGESRMDFIWWWLPASARAAGVSGTLVLPTRFGRGENGGREEGKRRGLQQGLPKWPGLRERGMSWSKGLLWGSPEAEGWYFIFWKDGVEATDQV